MDNGYEDIEDGFVLVRSESQLDQNGNPQDQLAGQRTDQLQSGLRLSDEQQQPQQQRPQQDQGRQGQTGTGQGQVMAAQGRRSVMWTQHLARTDQNAPTAKELAVTAGAVASEVIREFKDDCKVGFFRKWGTEKAFERKKTNYDSAAAVEWRNTRTNQQAAAQPAGTTSFADPANLSIEARKYIWDLMREKIDYMGYTDDEVFVDKFRTLYDKLKAYDKLNSEMDGPEWRKPDVNDKLRLYDVLKEYTVEQIKEKASMAAQYKAFYEAKMDIISNPFYMVLKKSDTASLDETELDTKINELTQTSPELAAYLRAMKKLRLLEKNGILRKRDVHSFKKTEFADGLNEEVKGHASLFNVRKKLDITGPGITSQVFDYKKKEDGTVKKSSDRKDTMSLEVEGSISANIAEASIETKSEGEYFDSKLSGDVSLGDVKVYGKIGASIFDGIFTKKDADGQEQSTSRKEGYIGAEVGASAAALKAKGSASTATRKKFLGIKLFEAGLNLSGEVASAKAYAAVRAGRYTEKDEVKNDKDELEKVDFDADGLTVVAGVSASLLSGKAVGYVTIFGVKISLSVTGTFGSVGASAGATIGRGKMGVSLGGELGVGAKISIGIDFSAWLDLAKERLFGKSDGAEESDENKQTGSDSATSAVPKTAEELLREEHERISREDEKLARSLQWQLDYNTDQLNLRSEDSAECERQVSTATQNETSRLVTIGENVHRPPQQFADPNYQIVFDDAVFKADELQDNVSTDNLFGPQNRLDLSSIKQSTAINDCYLISTLAGLAMTDPGYITSTLIKDDPQNAGFAQVRLYDEKGHPQIIKVSKRGIKNDGRQLWIQLVEKAALVFVGYYRDGGVSAAATFRHGPAANKDWEHAQFENDSVKIKELDMGGETLAYRLILGKDCISHQIKASGTVTISEAGNQAIGKALAWRQAGHQVTASTGSFGSQDVVERLRPHIIATHVYTVIGAGAQIDGKQTLKLRNPYLNGPANGEFDITYSEFKSFFTNVSTADYDTHINI